MRRSDDGVGTFCARPPQGLAARSIERLRHFVFTWAREGIEAVAYEDRCRVIAIDRDLTFSQPVLHQHRDRGVVLEADADGTAALRRAEPDYVSAVSRMAPAKRRSC